MTDKPYGPLEMPAEEVPRFYAGIINKMGGEMDALRAENEKLKERLRLAEMVADSDEYDVLRQMSTENERLKETIERGSNANAALETENERLRAELALAEHMLKNHIHLADNSSAAQAAPSPAADP